MERDIVPTTRIENIVEKTDKFYDSNWSVIFYMSATTIFALLQITLFYTGVLSVNGKGLGDEHGIQAFWITTALSISACYLGFMSGILNVKGNPKFLYFTMAQISLQVLVIYRAGMIFAIISFVISFLLFCHRAWVWKMGKLEEWNWNKKHLKVSMLILFIVLMTLFITICIIWGDDLYSKQYAVGGQWEGMKSWLYYFDAMSAVFVIVAAIFFTFRSRWAFILYFTSKIFLVVVYGATGNIIPLVQLLLFSTMDITGILAWSFKKEKEGIEYKDK